MAYTSSCKKDVSYLTPSKPLACAKLQTSLILNEKPETKQINHSKQAIPPTCLLPGIQISALVRLRSFPVAAA